MRLPIFLLAYRASTHNTTGLPCDLLFEALFDKERPTIDHVADLVDQLHNIHNYAHQHLKLASDRMKAYYDRLAKSAGSQEGEQVWLYSPTCTKGKSPKLQLLWKGPYRVVTQINNVMYRI
jgi:hypothetical protein